jgi:hypothetical protein
MTDLEKTLFDALDRMSKMHHLLMTKINHGASFYDAECIREMNEAPVQAAKALNIAVEQEAP